MRWMTRKHTQERMTTERRKTDRDAHTNIHNYTHNRHPTKSHMNAINKREGRLRVC